jgi:hypothetical protein
MVSRQRLHQSYAGRGFDQISGKVLINGDADSDTFEIVDTDGAGSANHFLTSNRIWGFGMAGSDEVNLGARRRRGDIKLPLGQHSGPTR